MDQTHEVGELRLAWDWMTVLVGTRTSTNLGGQ